MVSVAFLNQTNEEKFMVNGVTQNVTCSVCQLCFNNSKKIPLQEKANENFEIQASAAKRLIQRV